MKYKKIIALLVLLIVSGSLAYLLFLRDFFAEKTGGSYRHIANMESSYEADVQIAQALDKLKTSQEKVRVVTRGNTGQRAVALTFDGLTDRATVQQILDLLKKYDAKATFFVDGIQTAEDPQTVVNIRNEGHKIENYTLSGMVKMENLPVERLVRDFCRAEKIIKVTSDIGPNLLKCNDTKYTDLLLRAAKACGFNGVVVSDAFLNVKQVNALKSADGFVGGIRPGSIVSVKLKPNIEPIVNEPGKTNDRPAIDKQPGLKQLPQQIDQEDKAVVDAVEKLLIALKKANYATIYVDDLPKGNASIIAEQNNSLLVKAVTFLQEQIAALFSFRTAYAAEAAETGAKEIKMIYTTEPAVAYSFGGLSNQAAVNDVLGRLNSLGIKATFFIMEVEMRRYPDTVRKIIANGHEIGIGIRPKNEETAEETKSSILRARKLLQEQFGVTTNLVKQPWGSVADATKEAVAAADCYLIGQSVNVVQSKHKDYTSADQVMAEIFGKNVFSLARGQIVYFRMDYYTNDRLVGDLLEVIKQRKIDNIAFSASYDNPVANWDNDSRYAVRPVGQILNNKKFVYQYPVDPQNILARLRNWHGRDINEHNFLAEASKRFVGNEEVTYEDRMYGFSKMDARRLDQSGFIHTEDNVIFLSFDDWGSDAAINKLLYVLRKHNVPATFFVITNNILNNPNLLRTIAVQGNDIGNHTDKHKAMVVRDPKTGLLVQTQEKQEFVNDLAVSRQKLFAVTGDVVIDGKPALTRFFRPPTLAISKMSLETLLENGYDFIICGSSSTYDYKAGSVTQLVRRMEEGLYTKYGEVKKGAVLVMHMGDAEIYTAVALDILLTANEAKADSDPSKFKVGRLSDYLVEGYSQFNRKTMLK